MQTPSWCTTSDIILGMGEWIACNAVIPTKLSERLQFVGMPAMQAREWREDEREEKACLPLITWKLLPNIPRPCCAFLSQCVIQILVDYPHPYSPPGIVSGVG